MLRLLSNEDFEKRKSEIKELLTNKRSQCEKCLVNSKCDVQYDDNIILCFKKVGWACPKCKLQNDCGAKEDESILCPNYIPMQEISKINYME